MFHRVLTACVSLLVSGVAGDPAGANLSQWRIMSSDATLCVSCVCEIWTRRARNRETEP